MVRFLTHAERLMHELVPPHGLYSVVRLVVRGVLDEQRLARSLEQLCLKYPTLGWRVVGEGETLRFEVSDTPLPYEIVGKTDGPTLVERLLLEPFEGRAQADRVWRLVVVRDTETQQHELVWCVHHAVADGYSTFTLANAWLAIYAGAPATPEAPALPLADQARLVLSRMRLALLAVFAFGHELWRNLFRVHTVTRDGTLSERQPIVRERYLPRAQIDALRALCRAQRTTMQGFYSALMLTVVHELLTPAQQVRFSCAGSINLRALLRLPPQTLGVYFANFETRHSLPRDLWALARDCQKQFERLTRRLIPLGWATLLRVLVRDFARVREQLQAGSGRQQTVFVSNLGVLPTLPAPADALVMHRASAYVPQHRTGALAWLGSGTFEDYGVFCFLFTAPLLSAAEADVFVERFFAIIEAMTAAPSASARTSAETSVARG